MSPPTPFADLYTRAAHGGKSRIHQLSVDEALDSMNSRMEGLDDQAAQSRLAEFGTNTIQRLQQRSRILEFLTGLTHFFALILWCGALIAFFAEWKEPGNGMGLLGWAIVAVIIINAVFSYWQEYQAEQAIEALQKLIPHTAKAVRGGKLVQVNSATLVPGDIVYLEEGNDIPADCRLLEGLDLRVNNATITGESMAVERNIEKSKEADIIRSQNILLAGTSIASGQGKSVVFATGMHTEFGKIAVLTQSTEKMLSPLQKEIVRLSRVIAAIALTVGVIFFLIGCAMGLSFWPLPLAALV
jgi:magnesium-transporting ATPase (P-type)